eukprot:362480-Chlamydomonas_euryale.AAC.4
MGQGRQGYPGGLQALRARPRRVAAAGAKAAAAAVGNVACSRATHFMAAVKGMVQRWRATQQLKPK